MNLVITLAAGLVLATSGFGSLAAQVRGAPISYSPIHDPGGSIHVETGHGLKDLSGAHYWGVRGTWGPGSNGRLRLSAMGGLVVQPGSSEPAFGAAMAFQPYRRKLILADIQAGIGYGQTEVATGQKVSDINVLLGTAFGVNGISPKGNIQLWLAPRIQLRVSHQTGAATFTESRVGPGATLGFEYLHGSGFGAQAGLDWLMIDNPPGNQSTHELVVGGGLVFRFM